MRLTVLLSVCLTVLGLFASHAEDTLKVFILAGDENVLRQGTIDGIPRGPGSKPIHAAEAAKLPGTLIRTLADDPRFSSLRAPDGTWSTRKDVALYDAHPLSNNTRDPGRLLSIPSAPNDPRGYGVGVEHMFGHVIGEAGTTPALLIRFATKHQIWFQRGSRSLGYDYLPPSGGGGLDLDGNWDVIHFNHGVWDLASFDATNQQRATTGNLKARTSIEDYEKISAPLLHASKKPERP